MANKNDDAAARLLTVGALMAGGYAIHKAVKAITKKQEHKPTEQPADEAPRYSRRYRRDKCEHGNDAAHGAGESTILLP